MAAAIAFFISALVSFVFVLAPVLCRSGPFPNHVQIIPNVVQRVKGKQKTRYLSGMKGNHPPIPALLRVLLHL